jgi:hypothetical protein
VDIRDWSKGVSILAAKEFGIDHPSKLSMDFIAGGGQGAVYLHAMHSVVDRYRLEGLIGPAMLEPESIPLVTYKRSRSRWKFWRDPT